MKIKTVLTKLFKRKKYEEPDEYTIRKPIETAMIIYQTDAVNDIYDIFAQDKKDIDYDEKAEYIAQALEDGNESLLRFSNIIMYMEIPYEEYSTELIRLNTTESHSLKIKINTENDISYTLISGSLYDFKEVIRNTSVTENNTIINQILMLLYGTNKCFFKDFIKYGMMNQRQFFNFPTEFTNNNDPIKYINLDIKCVDDFNIDNMLLSTIISEHFSQTDLLDITNIIMYVKNITKLSIPLLYKYSVNIHEPNFKKTPYNEYGFKIPQRVNTKKQYKFVYIEFNQGQQIPVSITNSLYELNTNMLEIINQLRKNGLTLQESISYLPLNTICPIYMKMSLKELLSFINDALKEDSNEEINTLGKELFEIITDGKIKLLDIENLDQLQELLIPNCIINKNSFEYNNNLEETEEYI